MTSNQIWFITGASRGMGVDFAKAALASGAGADAIALAAQKAADLKAKIDAYRELSTSLALDEPAPPEV
jgi:NAD(P)-dependent dehydrogenase (short-subunit alcohol dehydrogenase family)